MYGIEDSVWYGLKIIFKDNARCASAIHILEEEPQGEPIIFHGWQVRQGGVR